MTMSGGSTSPGQPPLLSPDGSQILIGDVWQPTQLSPDRRFYWDGSNWQPLPLALSQRAGQVNTQGSPAPAVAGGYAGFWIRLLAWVIDAAVLGIPLSVLLAIMGGFSRLASDGGGGLVVWYLIVIIAQAAYLTVMWSRGATLGMQVLGLRVVSAVDGNTLSAGRAFARWVDILIAAAPCYLGLFWVGWDAKKQGWHDKLAKTVVLRST